MSTDYDLRRPLSERQLTEQTNWRFENSSHGRVMTDGHSYAHPHYRDGFVVGFTRFGRNDVQPLVRALDAISEHDAAQES
jgi:hypothetical protein